MPNHYLLPCQKGREVGILLNLRIYYLIYISVIAFLNFDGMRLRSSPIAALQRNRFDRDMHEYSARNIYAI